MDIPILKVEGIKKYFGGIKVLENVSFELKQGEFKTIIGPNGAGKTTLYNIISGVMRPTAGKIFYREEEITKYPPYKIAKLGICRSFQTTNLFSGLSAHENIRLAVQSKSKENFNIIKESDKNVDFINKAYEIIRQVKLEGKEEILAKNLTHTEKRKLELGIALALSGDILLLDEPTAGVAAEEVPELFKIVEDIHKNQNKSILLIEHKIGIILSMSDTIAVLQNGVLIADDTPENIQKNQKVQDAYFGGGAA